MQHSLITYELEAKDFFAFKWEFLMMRLSKAYYMRWRYRYLTLALCTALAGCSDTDTPAKTNTQQRDWSQLTLRLGDQSKILFTVAEAAGTLKDTPYRIEWANFQGAAPLFEALRAGAVDLAPAGDTPVLAAATGATPLKIIASRSGTGRSIAILVPENSPIHSLKDLEGRNVVVSSARGSIAQYLLIRALAQAGVDEQKVNVGFVLPTDALAAFNAGQIEAWATFGIYQAFAEEAGARVLIHGEGINSGLGFITAADSALADPLKRCALSDVLVRLSQAFDWAQKHPEEYAQIFATANSVPLNVSKRLRSWGDEIVRPVTDQDVQTLQDVDDLFVAKGIFPHAINTQLLADKNIFSEQGPECSGLTQPTNLSTTGY